MTGNDTNDLFKKSIDKFLGRSYERNSIGILQEKTLHSIVKDFYAPSDDAKEIRVGDFVADICYEDKIVEIQNGNFTHLVPKLEAFLPKYKVTVVYPIPYRKWMCWIDPETGELTKRNAPRGCFNLYKVFRDLYSIRKYLDHPGFTLILTCLELEEYRLLDGWSKDHKKGSHRYDRIPLNLLDEIVIKGKEGYNRFLPDELTDEFTIKEFQKLVRYRGKYFGTAIKVLEQLGLIERCGMRKRAYLYRKVDSSKDNSQKDNSPKINSSKVNSSKVNSSKGSNLKTIMKKDNNKKENKTENKEMAVKKTKTATKKTASKAATTKTATKAKNIKVSEETVIDRFLRYVKFDTQSDERSGASPSTPSQHELAKALVSELETIGASDVYYDKEHCYVYATIPSTLGRKKAPVLGFISHMDTSDACSGKDVKARIVEKYDGKDVVLNESDPETGAKIVLSPKTFPELLNHKGEDLIVTDGTTLLGADDKAGISEIMTMAAYLLSHPEIKHGKIRIGFTPDEEIGEGTKFFDLKRFGADFAYTVDGGKLGELEYECFNAAEVELIIHGRSVHPGDAKGKMLNASLIAYEFQSMLPQFDNPMYTEKKEGFFHLTLMKGTCEKAVAYYIIRDHDKKKFTERKKLVEKIVKFLNDKYGAGTVELTMEDSYYNMIEKLKPHMHLIDNARKAMEQAEVTSIENPIRGGTDGAMLSFKGLPCPNLCTGGYNYHGKYEYASVQEMYKTVEILENLAQIYGSYKG
nr:peptidase T [Butyrivibrio fibrisolvens]